MANSTKPLLIIIIAIAVAGGAAFYMSRQSTPAAAPSTTAATAGSVAKPAPTGGGRVRGPANAPVTLVEFGDYQCPSCGYFAPIMLEILKRYPEQVRLEFHHFPLVGIHQWAMPAALAAEAAADQGKFWEMHDLIYENQEKWSRSANPESEFLTYAGRIGLNINSFMQAMRSPDTQQRVLQDVVRARESDVNETPTFYLNGQKIAQRPNTADEFSRLIQQKLPH